LCWVLMRWCWLWRKIPTPVLKKSMLLAGFNPRPSEFASNDLPILSWPQVRRISRRCFFCKRILVRSLLVLTVNI
jgi:hypothetical protein